MREKEDPKTFKNLKNKPKQTGHSKADKSSELADPSGRIPCPAGLITAATIACVEVWGIC